MPWKLTSNHGWKFSYLHFITIYKYIFCWCVLKRKKMSIMHCCRQLGTSYKRIFHPRAVLGGSLREGMQTLKINRGVETGPTNSIISSWSLRREYRASLSCQILPQPSLFINSISGIRRETLKCTQSLPNCHLESRCYHFPISQRLFGVILRTTKGLYWRCKQGGWHFKYWHLCMETNPSFGLVVFFFSLQKLDFVIGLDKTVSTTSRGWKSFGYF